MSIMNITKENFGTEVLQSNKPVLLDFWASWCGPCRMLAPVIDEVSNEVGNVKIGKINVDEEQELAAEFGIMSIPTLIVMKEGRVLSKEMGFQSKNQILGMLPSR